MRRGEKEFLIKNELKERDNLFLFFFFLRFRMLEQTERISFSFDPIPNQHRSIPLVISGISRNINTNISLGQSTSTEY